MRTSEILDKAAKVLQARGLHKGSFIPSHVRGVDKATCPVCVIAAINVAAGKLVDESPTGAAGRAANALADHLGLDSERHVNEVLGDEWNDRPGISQGQVIAALRAAAEHERENLR